ncbi:MAG: ABC transporter permease [Deltaproteobacteria bacterium]|nr:ABC transporter permease [Deltaproteobacteria bacterium]
MFLGSAVYWTVKPPYRVQEIFRQLDFVGAQSVTLIAMTGAFTGMVSALQGYNGMSRYGAESLVGATTALALARELGPVLTGLMIVGRVGSAMTAELGSMRNTQQIDALESMAVAPIQYLVSPRIVAATLTLPFLSAVFGFSGMIGAYIISTKYLNIDAGAFMSGIRDYLTANDIVQGIIKAFVFGFMLSLVACFKGYYADGGARGVGVATTQSVVLSSVLILFSDYVMTTIMF